MIARVNLLVHKTSEAVFIGRGMAVTHLAHQIPGGAFLPQGDAMQLLH